jgi:hypothetical protein
MKPFLHELAESIYKEYRQLDELTLVFPNRRAVLYFRKYLSTLLDKPVFSPRLVTIEDFIADLSSLKVPDKLELIHKLYNSYHEIIGKSDPEPFDRFYFWGDMLLRDFDEADKYLINAQQLFLDLSHQKELDATFDYLTEEQRDFLRSFWSSFEENLSENKKKFLSVWNKLYELYSIYRESLLAEGLAYEGMMHRRVAEQIKEVGERWTTNKKIIFAGFNALTRAEEKVICYLVERGIANVFWDTDAYYVNNNTQEAGKFFREYQQHEVLSKTFSQQPPSNFLSGAVDTTGKLIPSKSIRIFGAAEPVSQAKMMAQILQEQLQLGIDPDDTLIVLPDEKLLLPVLHGLSGNIEKLNVSMGFPVSNTPLFNLVELLVELQIKRKEDLFNHRQVIALFGHPYVVASDPAVANAKRKEILNDNWVYVPKSFLATSIDLHRSIFREVETDILSYLREILTIIGALDSINDFDREYTFHFLKLLNRMEEVIGFGYSEKTLPDDNAKGAARMKQQALKSFLRLFRQLIQTNKIPFSGEPLKGLQVMGVLETRNLDFKNVLILSLNEGAFPSSANKGSYIPLNIRRAYGLPTVEHQDAMYAYLFYRVLQRAENVMLFYNAETDVLGQGEMSRYLQQLLYESGLKIERRVLHNPIRPNPITPIVVKKDKGVMESLAKIIEGNTRYKGISPSALNTYIECRLRFYLRHVLKIREANEVEEDLDARVLGNFLHEVMELFYKRIAERKNSKLIEAGDFAGSDSVIEKLIDEVFVQTYKLDPQKVVQYEGQRLVVREVVKRFAGRIVEIDLGYTPFFMEALEQEGLVHAVKLDSSPPVLISGKIDRVDRKENILRVIDYKTGRDQLEFDTISSLFSREGKRNKAAFQTLLYALLYKSNTDWKGFSIVPGLINRMNLFDRDFRFGLKHGKNYVEDVDPILPEFEHHLKLLLEDLFDPEVAFSQTDNVDTCRFCEFQGICYR